jgi:hypothetical protein
MVEARKLLEGASFDPPTLKIIGQAFDEAWATIAGRYSGDKVQTDLVRVRLAHAVLAHAVTYGNDLEALKAAALLAFPLSP